MVKQINLVVYTNKSPLVISMPVPFKMMTKLIVGEAMDKDVHQTVPNDFKRYRLGINTHVAYKTMG